MTTSYANVDGEYLIEGKLHIPNVGPWWADVVFQASPEFADSQRVTLNLGGLELSGTVDPNQNGTFGTQRRMRIVAGANGWAKFVTPQHYHNDAGVLARTIAQDAARLAGETLGAFAPAAEKVGIDYVRQSAPAVRTLEDVIGGEVWWVNAAGETVVGERTTSEVSDASYEVLEYSPAEKLATMTVDDLTTIGIGSIFTNGLDAPLTAFQIEVVISPERARVMVWGGGTAKGRGRLAANFEALVTSVLRRRLFGKYSYRVIEMSGNRVKLQAVAANLGLPDLSPVSMKPGVAGAWASLVGGSIVVVEFLNGDRTMPMITAFAGKDEGAHAPESLELSVVTTLRLGGPGASDAVALAPTIDSQFDDINVALDALAVATPGTSDGGLALQTAFKAAWGTGMTPKPASNVGASKVMAE